MLAAAKKMLESYTPTKIVFGENVLDCLEQRICSTQAKNVLLITGGKNSFVRSGAADACSAVLKKCGLVPQIFAGVPAEPDVEIVRAIVKKIDSVKPDLVLAVGGGSVMDAAKAAYLSWQADIDIVRLFGAGVVSKIFPERIFQHVICIPTTSGTGSEITPYSNIVDKAKNLKYIIVDRQIVPDLALIDSSLTFSMGRELTVATALDAMTHSIESLLNCRSENADPAAENWALMSVELIRNALPCYEEVEARNMLAAAAALGGMCIACRPTALPHLCSYSMWGKVPHGLAVALLLPHFWRYYLEGGIPEIAEQTMKLSPIFGGSTPEDVVRDCETFIAEVSTYKKLSEMEHFDSAMVEKIAADAILNPVKLQTAPRPVALDDARDLIYKILRKSI